MGGAKVEYPSDRASSLPPGLVPGEISENWALWQVENRKRQQNKIRNKKRATTPSSQRGGTAEIFKNQKSHRNWG